jgi:hypothetical protein
MREHEKKEWKPRKNTGPRNKLLESCCAKKGGVTFKAFDRRRQRRGAAGENCVADFSASTFIPGREPPCTLIQASEPESPKWKFVRRDKPA